MLIPSNLTYFQEGMELWPLWQTMVASLLMYHFDVASAYGPTNAVVSQVLEIAQLINIECPGVYDPVKVLKIWYKLIADDYRSINCEDVGMDLKETIARQSQEISTLTDQLSNAVTQLNQLNTSMFHLQKIVAASFGAHNRSTWSLESILNSLIEKNKDGLEGTNVTDLVSPPQLRVLNPQLVPPSSLKKCPPLSTSQLSLKAATAKQMKICDSTASISISSVFKRLSKRHFSHYRKLSKVAFNPLACVVVMNSQVFGQPRWMSV